MHRQEKGVCCRNPKIEQSPSLLGSLELPTSSNLDYRFIRDGGLQAETIFLFSIVTSTKIAVLGAYLGPNIILLNMHCNYKWTLFHLKPLLTI